jgi:hypothetical protein
MWIELFEAVFGLETEDLIVSCYINIYSLMSGFGISLV